MNAKVKKLWVKELRGGDFVQGQGLLRQKSWVNFPGVVDKCCCLGVLCELAIEDGVSLSTSHNELGLRKYTLYDGHNTTLPEAVIDWSEIGYDESHELSSRNDSGHSFTRIANYIEANL